MLDKIVLRVLHTSHYCTHTPKIPYEPLFCLHVSSLNMVHGEEVHGEEGDMVEACSAVPPPPGQLITRRNINDIQRRGKCCYKLSH